MEGIVTLPFDAYPIAFPLLFQIGLLGELLVAYFDAGGNVLVHRLALAGRWYMIPLGLPANDGIFDVIPVLIVLLMVDSTVTTGSAPHPQWVGDNGVFQPELPPNLPPNKDAIIGSKTNGKKVQAKVPSRKESKLNMDVGPIKATTRQDHEPTNVRKEKKQLEPQQKSVGKDDEAVVGEVDDFPELALLPKEWTY